MHCEVGYNVCVEVASLIECALFHGVFMLVSAVLSILLYLQVFNRMIANQLRVFYILS